MEGPAAGEHAAVVEFAAAVGKYAEVESGTAAKYAAEKDLFAVAD